MKLERIEDLGKQSFVETAYIKNIADRSLLYLNTGYAIHFKGPSGTGKTSLALYIAKLMDRPVQLMFGNEDFGREDLIGGNLGITKKITYDNFIHSVTKHQEDYTQQWVDGRLLEACKAGVVLVYDEFTRTKPEANNVLLSILEEGIVEVPLNKNKKRHIKVHPDFRIIFTSNPEEYSGVHKAQDALNNRMITLELDFPDRETEIEIITKNTGISNKTICEAIADIVRTIRYDSNIKFSPTIRSSIMIASVLKINKLNFIKDKELVKGIFNDILFSEASKINLSNEEKEDIKFLIFELLLKHGILK